MFCSRLRAGVRPHLGRLRRLQSSPSTRRTFLGQSNAFGYEYSQHPVRFIGPTIFTLGTIGTIYFTCAAYDVYRDVQEYRNENRRILTFDDIEVGKAARLRRGISFDTYFGRGPIVASSPSTIWENLGGPSKVITGITLANVAVMGIAKMPSPAAQQWWISLAHTPAYPWFEYKQLFTHMFGHTGAFHLGFNMFALINFGPSVAQSSPFNGSGSHFLAFYLSAGLLSSLGSHLSTLIFKNNRFSPGMGASGAIFGVFSAWAMTHQETKVRVFPFPKVFAARELLEYEVGFELLGLLGLWRALRIPINWGHAAHLGGLGAGLAYVTYAGKRQVWNTSRRAAFRSMKLLRMV